MLEPLGAGADEVLAPVDGNVPNSPLMLGSEHPLTTAATTAATAVARIMVANRSERPHAEVAGFEFGR